MTKQKYKDHIIIITDESGKFAYSIDLIGHIIGQSNGHQFESADLALEAAKSYIDNPPEE